MAEVASKIEDQLSREGRQVLHIARKKAREYMHTSIGAPHLLWALLNKEVYTYNLVREMGKDIFYLQEWATVRLEDYPKANKTVTHVENSKEIEEILKETDQLRFEMNQVKVDPVILLAVLCIPGLVFSYDQLKTFSLTRDEVLQAGYRDSIPAQNGVQDKSRDALISGTLDGSSSDAFAEKYCHDLHNEVASNKYFSLIERNEEINTCLEVLTRYAKANLIITGEPGVGKTALIHGLVKKFDSRQVPDNLSGAHMLELDLAAIQAGASYKGELEDRFQNILSDLKKMDNAILVIENIHSLLDKNNNLSSLSGLLTMELNRRQFTIIGTTTPEYYRKNIEKDETFSRQFETLTLEEPHNEDTAKIIRTVITPHEEHHSMQVDDDTITESVRLAKRYEKERRLPDAAIDLIDRSMARTRITVNKIQRLLQQVNIASDDSEDKDETETGLRGHYSELRRVSDRFLADHFDISLKEASSFEDDNKLRDYADERVQEIERMLGDHSLQIIEADLSMIIARKTGIPAGKIQTQERKRLLEMEDSLRERVVGQDGALKSVTEAVLESRSGLLKGKQPVGSFFFLGPTGTGKTELAKALSEFLFQDERAMIRFDMSEFKEEHSAAMLYGSPPGYVGYEEGGMLVNKIRERPYSVVLFDEIEKAHNSVFDIFLQILDEGKLNDRLGRVGDFTNALVLFTSNIASQKITNAYEKDGTLPSSQQLMEELSGYFRPEFLGRLTEIVPFAPISEEVLLRIFEINLNELLDATGRKGVALDIETDAKRYLSQLGYSPQYGARPLKGVIRDKIRRPLSRMLIEGRVENDSNIQLSINNDNKLQWNIN